MHEQEGPAVGNLGVGPEEHAFDVEGVGVGTALVGVGVAALGIAVELDAVADVLHPVGRFIAYNLSKQSRLRLNCGCVLLPHGGSAAEDGQCDSKRCLGNKITLFHCG